MKETKVSLQHRHNEFLHEEPAKTHASPPNSLDLEVFSFFAFGGVRRLRDYKIHGTVLLFFWLKLLLSYVGSIPSSRDRVQVCRIWR